MMATILYLIFIAVALLAIVAGVTVWRRSRMDGLALIAGGLYGLTNVLSIWGLRELVRGNNRLFYMWSFTDTRTIYVVGLFFLLSFFVTQIRGWQRVAYLAGGLTALSPLITLTIIAVMFMMSGTTK